LTLDLDAFSVAPVVNEPFAHVVVPCAVIHDSFEDLEAAFPEVPGPGSFPLSSLQLRPPFSAFVQELLGDTFRRAVEEKFGVSLSNRPCSVTIRGFARAKDGSVHTDSKNKLITVLIYMNADWTQEGGRLRLLKSPNLWDLSEEILPIKGALVAFQRSDQSWHGHEPCEGARRVVQLNWLVDEGRADLETLRHRLSAIIKKWTGGLRRSIGR